MTLPWPRDFVRRGRDEAMGMQIHLRGVSLGRGPYRVQVQ
ncbi:MAG: hypothetical protein QG671_3336 [Actinomycetota bacterium]|nr:hypothetical protein [Actinomycetota bacterium]